MSCLWLFQVVLDDIMDALLFFGLYLVEGVFDYFDCSDNDDYKSF